MSGTNWAAVLGVKWVEENSGKHLVVVLMIIA